VCVKKKFRSLDLWEVTCRENK